MKDEIFELVLYWDEEHEMYHLQYAHSFLSESTNIMPVNLAQRLNQIIAQILREYHSSKESVNNE